MLINASLEFEKGRPKNFIPDEKIKKIAKAFYDWKDAERFARIVTTKESAKNDYNISPSRYIETGTAEEYKDIPTLLQSLSVFRR